MIPLLDTYKERWNVQSERIIKPGLAAMKEGLARIGHPEQRLACVHVAGTNGKGSTITFLEEMLLAHGLSVGKFMSPCIFDVHDQIQVDGEPITSEEMDAVFTHMQQSDVSGLLTEFELLTCAAFTHFANAEVDIVLLEAGMGGREDSTNVIEPILSIIPSIALEHTNFLGDTLEKIAHHKAGIIKYRKPIVIGRLPDEAVAVVKQEARQQNAPLLQLGEDFDVQDETYTSRAFNVQLDQLKRSLIGPHQGDNMALALTAFFYIATELQLQLDAELVREAVYATQVPGRFEQVLPNVYFDGAHNPASAAMLAKTIEQQFVGKRVEIIFGMLADKDIRAVLELLKPCASKFYFMDIQNERAMDATAVQQLAGDVPSEVVSNCLLLLASAAAENIVRVVTGSLYLLTDIRQQLAK